MDMDMDMDMIIMRMSMAITMVTRPTTICVPPTCMSWPML